MHPVHFSKAVLAGIVGTLVMSILILILQGVGASVGGQWALLAGFLGTTLFVGWILHFVVGSALALIYAGFVAGNLAKTPYAGRGAFYGVMVWLVAMLIALPIMGMPVFAGGFGPAFWQLVSHLAYGTVVGAVYQKGYASEHARTLGGQRRRVRGH